MTDLGDSATTTTFDQAGRLRSHIDIAVEDARRQIAVRVIWGYLAAIAVVLLVPLLLMVISDEVDAGNAKDLVLALTAAVAGLNGVVGFVVGYYFKSADIASKRE